MYITINNQTYTDVTRTRLRGGDVLFTGESLSMTDVSGEIAVYRGDGFLLCTDDPSEYARTVAEAGRIRLTNDPEPDAPTAKKLRETAYETEKAVCYDGELITVDEANELWKQYSAEGDTEKAAGITASIAQAKSGIRARYPEEDENEHGEAGTGV